MRTGYHVKIYLVSLIAVEPTLMETQCFHSQVGCKTGRFYCKVAGSCSVFHCRSKERMLKKEQKGVQ